MPRVAWVSDHESLGCLARWSTHVTFHRACSDTGAPADGIAAIAIISSEETVVASGSETVMNLVAGG